MHSYSYNCLRLRSGVFFLIDDSPYYVFVALCIVVIVVVSLIKIAASNENIECFREYFTVSYRAPDPSFFLKFLHGSGQKISHLEYQRYHCNHNAKRYENVINASIMRALCELNFISLPQMITK